MESIKGKILSINVSEIKGVTKKPVKSGNLIENCGLEYDAHSGPGLKQISLLSIESIQKQNKCLKIKKVNLEPGDFAENITTKGLNLISLKIGNKLKLGKTAIIEISKIGKECHKYCTIYQKIGNCIMPKQGIFAKVITGGEIFVGDTIEVIENV